LFLLMGARLTGDAMVSEFLIALFAGMVMIATFRRRTPRAVEVVLWVGLVWVCVLAVTNTRDQQARALTGAVVWGASQMVGMIAAVAEQGAVQWMFDRRFFIADWVVLLGGACLLLLTFLATWHEGLGWQPRVRLGEWMELPRVAQQPQRAPITVSAVDEINQRFNAWAPGATAAALTWLTLVLIWTGNVVVPATARKLKGAALRAEVVDIEVLARRAKAVRVKAAGWLADMDEGVDLDVTERDGRDRLAS
jgi:hypothetical protein